MTKKSPYGCPLKWEREERRAGPVPILRQTLCQLSGAKGCDEQIKQFWRGNCSAPNQIYLRSPLRRTDVLSAKDFNSLQWDADKQPDGALQRLRFLFNCVFFPVDLFLANPRPSWRKSLFPPPPPLLGFLRHRLSWLLNARHALTSRWRAIGKSSSNGDQTAAAAPAWRCLLVCVQRSATILTEEVPALGNGSQICKRNISPTKWLVGTFASNHEWKQ